MKFPSAPHCKDLELPGFGSSCWSLWSSSYHMLQSPEFAAAANFQWNLRQGYLIVKYCEIVVGSGSRKSIKKSSRICRDNKQLSNLESVPFTFPSLSPPCSYVLVRSCNNVTSKRQVAWPEVTRNVGHWHWHFFYFSTTWPLEVFQRKAWRCLVTLPWIAWDQRKTCWYTCHPGQPGQIYKGVRL